MSVPRKGRLPAWHLLTDEGGSVNSRFLSALFPSAAQAHAAAEVLERRGAVLMAMETEPPSTPQPLRRSQTWLDWTSLIVSARQSCTGAGGSFGRYCASGVGMMRRNTLAGRWVWFGLLYAGSLLVFAVVTSALRWILTLGPH
jgi:hypothetical protein